MSLQRITPDDLETFTIRTNPRQTFISSSASGTIGSVFLNARHSPATKDAAQNTIFSDRITDESNLTEMLYGIVKASVTSSNIQDALTAYMSGVHAQAASTRVNKTLNVIRFTPPLSFNSNTLRKLLIKDTLVPFYRVAHPTMQWATTNYYALNFFTGSSLGSVPPDAALLYPDSGSRANGPYPPGNYILTSSWSFDFYINPRYTTDAPAPMNNFTAGTICHLSSCYALSMVTGSSLDINGYPNAYRLLLQLSQSAEIPPRSALPSTNSFSSSLVFLSNDNVLWRNHWHHVVVRWGTNAVNYGTGSFVVDGNVVGTFVVPSASVMCPSFASTPKNQPNVLVVGNFYEGNNTSANAEDFFFAADPALRDGLVQMEPNTGVDSPSGYAAGTTFRHMLNAEIHDLAIKRYYMTDVDIAVSSSTGPLEDMSRFAFFLPPFFTPSSPTRTFVGTKGGVPQTPFFAANGTTTTPFNTAMSFGVGGHLMNLENFTLDFANQVYPRLLNLTASILASTSPNPLSANGWLYTDVGALRRNLMIMPCDDGNFIPNFNVVARQAGIAPTLSNDLGIQDYSWISLLNMIPTASNFVSGALFSQIAGATPISLGSIPGGQLSVYQNTGDASSNEVVIFDISNMFYGKRILPGSFRVTDSNLTGSNGKIAMSLADDGNGNVYRADCLTPQATWNSVGNIYYNEGLVVVKSPNVSLFGQGQFAMSFKGDQNIHVAKLNIIAGAATLNSSSNPSYMPVSASAYPNDPDPTFVYITGINIHDADYNVIMKTSLAQPIVKRTGDKFLFRLRYDV